MTARGYGLRVDDEVDERHDIEKSTRAASSYIRRLILDFGAGSSVMLALAAYNVGPGKVRRAVRKVDGPDQATQLLVSLPHKGLAYRNTRVRPEDFRRDFDRTQPRKASVFERGLSASGDHDKEAPDKEIRCNAVSLFEMQRWLSRERPAARRYRKFSLKAGSCAPFRRSNLHPRRTSLTCMSTTGFRTRNRPIQNSLRSSTTAGRTQPTN